MIDLNECPCSGKSLAKLVKPAALTLLVKEDLHGYDVVQRLAALPGFAGGAPDTTGVYRALRNMEDTGLVTSTWIVSDAGPAKRCYHITEDGLACARRWLRTLRDYYDAVGALVRLTEETFDDASACATPACCGTGKAEQGRG